MLLKRVCFTLSPIAASIALAGCAYEQRAGSLETDAQASLISDQLNSDAYLSETTLTVARHAMRLSDRYKAQGDLAARQRDQFAAGLIAIVGATILANTASIGATEIATAGVVGVGLNEGAKYVNPDSAAEAFFKASNEMSCIGSLSIQTLGSAVDAVNLDVNAVLLQFIRASELRLRANLRRNIPDLADLISAFESEAANFNGFQESSEPAAILRAALAVCLGPEEQGS